MKRPEQTLQIAVVKHLNARSEPGVFWFHCPNGGKKSPQMGAIHKALGVVPGVPDLIILKGGKMYGLELKAPGGRLSDSQRLVGPRMEECGAEISVARSIDEALITLECWGILRRSVKASSPTAGE